MSFPIKLHLPLIMTRTEFTCNTVPPLPEITLHRDLGASIHHHTIRHHTQRSPVPYTWPKHNRGMTPVMGLMARRSVGFDSDAREVSPLSKLSSSKDSKNEDNPGTCTPKIPKPNGEVGRANSRGYNLQKALSWDPLHYENFIVSY